MEQPHETYRLPADCIMAFDVLYQAVSLAQAQGVYKLRDAHKIVEAIDTFNKYIPIEEETKEEETNEPEE